MFNCLVFRVRGSMFNVMGAINRFEDLEIWKNARVLCKDIRKLILKNESFYRDFSLKDQISGSSGSIMDNIAEGFGREGNKEFINFLTFSQGSCNETKSQLYRAYDFEYITEDELTQLFESIEKLANGIKALINYLKSSNYKGAKFKR